MERLKISLLNSTKDVYFAGQTIHGAVKFKLNERMAIKQIYLTIDGRARTTWTHKKHTWTSRPRSRTRHYSGTEVYISHRILLWPKQVEPSTSKAETECLYAGHYAFPFTLTIPDNCPSSLEATYGYIRYSCKAVIDRPNRIELKSNLPFTVVTLADLNKLSNDLLAPLHYLTDKTVNSLSCLAGNVECQVKADRLAFVPGEKMHVYVSVHNCNAQDIKKLKVQLVEIVIFSGHWGPKCSTKTTLRVVVRTQHSSSVKPSESGSKTNWYNSVLHIPPIAPTLDMCNVINVRYELQIKLALKSMANKGLKITHPVYIGNIPLSRTKDQFNGYVNKDSIDKYDDSSLKEPNGIKNGSINSLLSQRNYDLPPPSYEEAIFGMMEGGQVLDEEYPTVGTKVYRLRYPYYKME